jgi:hypothetical protein
MRGSIWVRKEAALIHVGDALYAERAENAVLEETAPAAPPAFSTMRPARHIGAVRHWVLAQPSGLRAHWSGSFRGVGL